ncbi:hypothetical protein FH609_014045 [Streptomyces sp. 3MP-14]|uniref:Uncharacterized protein n=1 Tax=Streptomyces mimosae TaxID=2586635 RepID=A0A5N6A8N7_9ACTN|nr:MULTISPECIES: hypothetical protein [Streptomyces]KAB8164316.1 hypothetical protein FH607_016935 [Streptomyces mimosae]KAB8176593.1 hypothetical protein FH609_014045 [Streptomyces sp. 3MP-14]
MGISDQFKDKAHELQERAKDAMGNKEQSKDRKDDKEGGGLMDKGRDAAQKAADRAKQRGEDDR